MELARLMARGWLNHFQAAKAWICAEAAASARGRDRPSQLTTAAHSEARRATKETITRCLMAAGRFKDGGEEPLGQEKL